MTVGFSLGSCPLRSHLLEPSGVKVSLQPADAIDEELAIEVIDLMLQSHGQEPLPIQSYFSFLLVQSHNLKRGRLS